MELVEKVASSRLTIGERLSFLLVLEIFAFPVLEATMFGDDF